MSALAYCPPDAVVTTFDAVRIGQTFGTIGRVMVGPVATLPLTVDQWADGVTSWFRKIGATRYLLLSDGVTSTPTGSPSLAYDCRDRSRSWPVVILP